MTTLEIIGTSIVLFFYAFLILVAIAEIIVRRKNRKSHKMKKDKTYKENSLKEGDRL